MWRTLPQRCSHAAKASARTRRTSSSPAAERQRVPARYVSGYLCTADDGATASHAWADAWLPESRCWIGIDVTHLEPAGRRHCRLAVGRDYLDAAPVRGVRRGGGQEIMEVDVKVMHVEQ